MELLARSAVRGELLIHGRELTEDRAGAGLGLFHCHESFAETVHLVVDSLSQGVLAFCDVPRDVGVALLAQSKDATGAGLAIDEALHAIEDAR